MTMRDLPTELLLDILETLLELGDKESQRSAAHLAQTCTALRTSEVGKRARYLHARAALSLSVPDKLPANLDYEIEVLETSVWPHQPPLEQPGEEPEGMARLVVAESFLETNGYVSVSPDRSELVCFVDTTQASGLASCLPHRHATPLMSGEIRGGIPLPAVVSQVAVSKDARYCAVLYDLGTPAAPEEEDEEDTEKVVETIDIWDIEALALALPEEQGRLRLKASDGYDEHGRIDCLQLSSEYLLLERYHEGGRVHRWKPSTYDPEKHFELLWTWTNAARPYIGLSLLAPDIVACLAYMSIDPPIACLYLYRLAESRSHHVVTFCLLGQGSGPSLNCVAAGAEIKPGEDGLMVIVVAGSVHLLRIATLVDILYPAVEQHQSCKAVQGDQELKETMARLEMNDDSSHADTKFEVQRFNLGWTDQHMFRFTKPEDSHRDIWPSVSGWRCIFHSTQQHRHYTDTSASPAVLVFVDASPKHCRAHQADKSSHFSSNCTPLSYEHELSRYLPTSVDLPEAYIKVEFKGGRMLLWAWPRPTEDHVPYLFDWRL